MIAITPMTVDDALAIQRQPSQARQVGLTVDRMSPEQAEDLAHGAGEAWAVRRDADLIAVIGLRETYPGKQAVAWAILSEGIGTAHLAITRFARARIMGSGLARIEAIARTAPECKWAQLVGLHAAHVLRKFGAASEDHILFERVA